MRSNEPLRQFVAYGLARTKLLDLALCAYRVSNSNCDNVQKILQSDDLAKIVKDAKSGVIHRGVQTLHHGVRVLAGSYYGPEYALLLEATQGVHEPQEEWCFQNVLERLMSKTPGQPMHMVEMGAFWGFYSLWFLLNVPNSTARLIEPDSFNLQSGRRNAELNGVSNKVILQQAYIGDKQPTSEDGAVYTSLDALPYLETGRKISIVHADIQGHELDMLKGARETLRAGLVEYLFISTHSESLHSECLKWLSANGFSILASHTLAESYSNDGLIVAASSACGDTETIGISRRT